MPEPLRSVQGDVTVDRTSAWMLLGCDRRGVTALEYGLIASAVSVAIVSAFSIFSPSLINVLTDLFARLTFQ
jgi:Flp pilus assembly pilin Flp